MNFKRRDFLKVGGISALGLANLRFSTAFSQNEEIGPVSDKVNFIYDGLNLSSQEYASVLSQLTKKGEIAVDYYSNGGVVEELEHKMAEILGKESAVFMPTGTMANHIAVRNLAGNNKRIIVPAESHLYNDCGDCAQNLSGLNLIPINKGEADFTWEQVEEVLSKTASGRVKTSVGAILIESPVRRKDNAMFQYDKMVEVCEQARKQNIKLHLDGARMFNNCIHLNKSPAEIASYFDTVYVSLYKNFNAASGAILAGTKEFTKELFHIRRMMGGGMPQVWAFAAVALHYLPTFLDEYKEADKLANQFFDLLNKNENFEIEKIQHGSSVVKLKVKSDDLPGFRNKLEKLGISINGPAEEFQGFKLKINPSINRSKPEKLAKAFIENL